MINWIRWFAYGSAGLLLSSVAGGTLHAETQAGAVETDDRAGSVGCAARGDEAPGTASNFGQRRPRGDDLLIPGHIGGLSLIIPGRYFRDPPWRCRPFVDHVYLRVVVPSFEGSGPETKELLANGRSSMGILLRPWQWGDGRFGLSPHPMNRFLQAFAPGVDRLGEFPILEGLLHGHDRFERDVFFSRDGSGDVDFLMVCDRQSIPGGPVRAGWVNFPRCEQHFSYAGSVIVSQDFSRQWLADWREMKVGSDRLLRSFVADAPDVQPLSEERRR